jgi:hypothetical protein
MDFPRRRQVTIDFLFGGSLFRNPDACIAALWNVMEGYGVTGLLFYTTRLAPVALQAEQLEWKRKGSVVSSAQQVAARSTQHAAWSSAGHRQLSPWPSP